MKYRVPHLRQNLSITYHMYNIWNQNLKIKRCTYNPNQLWSKFFIVNWAKQYWIALKDNTIIVWRQLQHMIVEYLIDFGNSILKIEYFLIFQKIFYFPSQKNFSLRKAFFEHLNICNKISAKLPRYYTCIHLWQCLKAKQLLKPGVHGSSSVHRCERKESSTLNLSCIPMKSITT